MREALVSIVGSRGFVLPEFSTACRSFGQAPCCHVKNINSNRMFQPSPLTKLCINRDHEDLP